LIPPIIFVGVGAKADVVVMEATRPRVTRRHNRRTDFMVQVLSVLR